MSSSSNSSSRKRVQPDDSDSDDDYYSKMVDRAIDSDDERASVSSSPLKHDISDELALNSSDDENLELGAQRDFETKMKEAAHKANLNREKRYKKELDSVAADVNENGAGAEPRGIHVNATYEKSLKQLKEVNAAVEKLNTNRNDKKERKEKPKNPEDVDLTVKMLDDTSSMDFTLPMKDRMRKVFEKIATMLETSVDSVTLYFDNARIEQLQKPGDLKMTPGNRYYLDCMIIELEKKSSLTIKCRVPKRKRKPICLTVKLDTTFGEIRRLLVEKGAPQFKKLIFNDAEMSDDKTPQDVGMEHNDVVDAV